jgi:hypothetical protein
VDGLQAVQIAQGNLPELILLDMMLPKLSGLEAPEGRSASAKKAVLVRWAKLSTKKEELRFNQEIGKEKAGVSSGYGWASAAAPTGTLDCSIVLRPLRLAPYKAASAERSKLWQSGNA